MTVTCVVVDGPGGACWQRLQRIGRYVQRRSGKWWGGIEGGHAPLSVYHVVPRAASLPTHPLSVYRSASNVCG